MRGAGLLGFLAGARAGCREPAFDLLVFDAPERAAVLLGMGQA